MYILREPHPLFKIALWCLLEHGSHTPISYAYACIKSKYLQACRDMPIDWLVLQALGVLPLQYVSFWITWDCCCAKHVHHIQVKSESYPDCCPDQQVIQVRSCDPRCAQPCMNDIHITKPGEVAINMIGNTNGAVHSSILWNFDNSSSKICWVLKIHICHL